MVPVWAVGTVAELVCTVPALAGGKAAAQVVGTVVALAGDKAVALAYHRTGVREAGTVVARVVGTASAPAHRTAAREVGNGPARAVEARTRVVAGACAPAAR
jgi:hypothetical protein